MDPASIVGIVGSIFGITDIITRSLKGLVGLQSTYKAANLLVAIVIGHLTTVKAALRVIGEWTVKEADTLSREQLVSDVQRAVSCCEIIVLALDERVAILTNNSTGSLSAKAKIAFALEEQDIKGFSDHLGNQVYALNLLINAANCQTNQARTELLHAAETRQSIRQIEDDSSSYIQGDTASSIFTQRSNVNSNTELLDREFDFDDQILNSRVYQQALQSRVHSSRQGTGNQSERQHSTPDESPEIISMNSDKTARVPPQHETLRDYTINQGQVKSQSTAKPPELKLTEQNNSTDFKLSHPTRRKRFQRETLRDHTINQGQPKSQSTTKPPELELAEHHAKNSSTNFKLSHPTRRKRFQFLFAQRAKLAPQSPGTPTLDEVAALSARPPYNEHKILILGSSESGKTTLLKDFKLQLEGTCSRYERESFKEIVFHNMVQSMLFVLVAMECLGLSLSDPRNEYHVQTIFMQPPQMECKVLPSDVGAAIISLRSDYGIQECLRRSREYQLGDAAEFWFHNAERIMNSDYLPTDKDILHSRIRTIGVTEETFIHSNKTLHIFDQGGARYQQKEWKHTFDKVDVVIITVDIGNWDQLLFEDETVNRMHEDLTLFHSLVNSSWFVNTQFILLFTKLDKLKAKIDADPDALSRYFPDHPKNTTLDHAKAYIENRFTSLNEDSSKNIIVEYCSFFEGPSPASIVLSHI